MNTALAYAHYPLGRYKESISFINKAIRVADGCKQERLICVKRYLDMKQTQHSAEEIRAALEYFHKPETVAALYEDLEQHKNPLHSFVLRCDMQCNSDCLLLSSCKKKQTNQLMQLIFSKSKELDQSNLEKLFKEI